ncbi:hypothetical protein NYY86_28680, partial [Acinetobacter baumannii]|nr:hypothetical protein [Acinetobacter baumannii]
MLIIQVEGHVNAENKQKSNLQGIKEGFSYLKENVFIKRLIVLLIIVMILISPAAFLTPLMVTRSFGAEMWRLTAREM